MKIEMEKYQRVGSKHSKNSKPKIGRQKRKSLEDCEKEMREIFKGNKEEERKFNEEKTQETTPAKKQKNYQKLEKELQEAQNTHAKMVKANRLVCEGDHYGLEYLMGKNLANTLLVPDAMGRVGYADYEFHEIKNIIEVLKHKIENIQDQCELEPIEYYIKGTMVRENYESGRLQIFFNGRPPKETQINLLSEGFKWANRQGAWQRPLSNKARIAAENVINSTQELS